MSDLFKAVDKTREGKDWRDTITLEHDGDELEFCIRQMKDGEFYEVMSRIDRDEIEELQDSLPQDLVEEYEGLQSMDSDERSEEGTERMHELEEEIEEKSPDFLDYLSTETFNGIRQAAKIAVEPDDEDMQLALREHARQIEEETGRDVREPEDTRQWLKDNKIAYIIDESTDFLSFALGMECLMATADEEGN